MTFLITFILCTFMLQVLTGYSTLSILMPSLRGKSIHSIAESRRTKQLADAGPQYDEWGYRKDYDPHYVRALEIDTGVSVSELTTCSDAACLTCIPGIAPKAIESKVKVPITSKHWDKRLAEMEKMVNDEKEETARIERQVAEEAIYHKRYSLESFRPPNVPERAVAEIDEITNGAGEVINVIIRWEWYNNVYTKSLTTYEVGYAHGEPFLRKRKPVMGQANAVHAMSSMELASGILNGSLRAEIQDHDGLYRITDTQTGKFVGYCYKDTLNMLLMNARMGW